MKWFLVAYFSLSALTTVALIGKPRKSITPDVAVGCAVLYGALIAATLVWL